MDFIFWLIYFLLNAWFSIEINFKDPWEQLISVFVGSGICYAIDKILYTIAYEITGDITSKYDGYHYRSAVHWGVRTLLFLIVILIGSTGLYRIILEHLTHLVYKIVGSPLHV
ncbi:hypothetical protein [Clostridium sp. AN503]|uniref:hypothetical protein n=1 Tax=Clostridium sp. AN503 TaxID=3160598 RepID=UPI00345772B4